MAYLLLFAYIAVVFIRPHEIGDPLSDLKIVRALIILTCIAYLVFEKKRPAPLQVKFMTGFTAVLLLSALFNDGFGAMISFIPAFIPTALIPMIMVAALIKTQSQQVAVMMLCVITSLIMVHNGHAQSIHPEGIGWTGTQTVENGRIIYMGIFGDPNDLGMFLVMCLPFVAYFYNRKNKILKLLALGSGIALLYGIVLTNSRGSLIGVLSLCATYFMFRYGLKKSIWAGIASLPVLLVVMNSFRKIEKGESAQGRIDAWHEGFQMFFMNPVFGVGKGNFTDYNYHTAHNSFILVLAELGILGYLLWFCTLGLTIYAMRHIYEVSRKQLDMKTASRALQKEVSLNVAMLYSLVGFVTTCFFLSRSYILVFFIFIGLATASYLRAVNLEPAFALPDPKGTIKKLIKWAFGSIIGLNILVKILI